MTMSDSVGKHFRASLREGLLAFRLLLDGWITSLEARDRDAVGETAKSERPATAHDEAGGIANP